MNCPKCGRNDEIRFTSDCIESELFFVDAEDGTDQFCEYVDMIEEINYRQYQCEACGHEWLVPNDMLSIPRDMFIAMRAMCNRVALFTRSDSIEEEARKLFDDSAYILRREKVDAE